MQRIIPILLLTLSLPAITVADEITLSDRLDAITTRLGNDPTIQVPPTNYPDALQPGNDAMMPNPSNPEVKPQLFSPNTSTYNPPKPKWTPNYNRRDIQYMGQWLPIFVGEGIAVPVIFPKPIVAMNIVHADQLGLAGPFVPGQVQYEFQAKQSSVSTQIIVTAEDGTKYNLLAYDGAKKVAHGKVDAGGVLLMEQRNPSLEGVNLDDMASWELNAAGTLKMRTRMTRLLVAMYKKENVSGYKVLNFKGRILSEDPILRVHLIRMWHKPAAKHPTDGMVLWFYNKSKQPISIIPQYVKKALNIEGDFAINYEKDTILPHDYMPIYVVQRMPEGKKPLEEVPVDLNLMMEDVRTEAKVKR